MQTGQESIYTAVLWLGKLNSCVEKRQCQCKKGERAQKSGLILMASIEMQLRVTLAAAFKRPSRVSKSGLHGNYSCTISISLCQLHSLRWSRERKKAIKSGQNSQTRPKRIPTKSRKKMFRCSNNPWTKDETKKTTSWVTAISNPETFLDESNLKKVEV